MAHDDSLPPSAHLEATAPSYSLETFIGEGQDETRDDPDRTLHDHHHAITTGPPLPPLHPHAPHLTDPGLDDLIRGAELGRGAMGLVHEATQRSLSRAVAIKEIRPDKVSRFQRALVAEARILGQLAHPNIPPVHALFDGDHGPVLVMKKIDGVTWRTLLEDDQHPGWAATAWADEPPLTRHLHVLHEVCDPVRFAHTRGIVHRDIKPDNVMLGAFGEVYLMDWGVSARLSDLAHQGATVVGSPSYLAPEMAAGHADERSDVFLLGAVLHRLLTREARHQGRTIQEVLRAARTCVPYAYPDHLPGDLVALATAACARNPDERPQTVAAFQAVLRQHLRHGAARALVDTANQRLGQAQQLLEHHGAPASAASLLTEARFASQEALRQWPEHPTARDTLVQVATQGVTLAIGRGDLDAADAWLADAERLGPEVQERLATLRDERARQQMLHQAAADLDPEIGRLPRTIFVGGSAIAMLGVAWAVARTGQTYAFPVWASGNAAVFTLLALTMARKHLLATAFNRRVTLFVLLASLGIFVNRFLSSQRGTSLSDAFATDMLMLSAMAGAAAITVDAWLIWLAAIAVVAATVSSYQPAWTPQLLAGSAALAALVTGVRWTLDRAGR